jgi:hypothetical protein
MRAAVLLLPLVALCQEPPNPPAKASLEGHVVNAVGGEPLRKVRLSLRMNVAGGSQQRQSGQVQVMFVSIAAQTDATGKFVFENVDPGDYQLTARRDGFATETLGALTEGKKREPVVLAPGDRKSGLVIKMTPHAVISGRVVDEDGDPIQGVPVSTMVYEYTSRGRELVEGRSTSTDDRGEYRMFDVPAGKYLLKFAHRGMRMGRPDDAEYFAATYFPGVPEPANAAPLEIKAGQQLNGIGIALRKARLATIRGRVIAPPNVSVSVGLMISTDRGTSSTSNSIEDKEYRFMLPGLAPGPVYITANYMFNGQRFNAQLPVEVGSSDINGLELRPGPPLEIPGTVRIDGQSTEKVGLMQISAQVPGRGASESVKDDGTFLLRGLSTDRYRIAVNRAPSLYIKSIQWGTSDITTELLDLTVGLPPRPELSIVLGADGAQIEGAVMNDKEPAEGAVVTLIPTGNRRAPQYFKNATVGSNGRFTLRAIAPGPYRVIAWDKVNVNAVIYDPDFLRPYETAGQSFILDPGEKKSVELKVTANVAP